ncbi:hypothetical protein M0R19_04820 [Candidatus Pacearchaeota archaeon]|jgi:hypothetical protein|nr:hypothetical protein [Candidatus Pacearchaeota archaeon]
MKKIINKESLNDINNTINNTINISSKWLDKLDTLLITYEVHNHEDITLKVKDVKILLCMARAFFSMSKSLQKMTLDSQIKVNYSLKEFVIDIFKDIKNWFKK